VEELCEIKIIKTKKF